MSDRHPKRKNGGTSQAQMQDCPITGFPITDNLPKRLKSDHSRVTKKTLVNTLRNKLGWSEDKIAKANNMSRELLIQEYYDALEAQRLAMSASADDESDAGTDANTGTRSVTVEKGCGQRGIGDGASRERLSQVAKSPIGKSSRPANRIPAPTDPVTSLRKQPENSRGRVCNAAAISSRVQASQSGSDVPDRVSAEASPFTTAKAGLPVLTSAMGLLKKGAAAISWAMGGQKGKEEAYSGHQQNGQGGRDLGSNEDEEETSSVYASAPQSPTNFGLSCSGDPSENPTSKKRKAEADSNGACSKKAVPALDLSKHQASNDVHGQDPQEEEEEEMVESEESEEDEENEEPGVRGSISKLNRFIERGAKDVLNQIECKRNAIVVGLTGSGKSTLINSMANKKMRRISQTDADRNGLPRDTIEVVGRACSKIGNTYGQSETRLVKAIPLMESDTILWDAPGFEDSSGEEQNIANAVNLQRLLEASSRSSSRGFVILVVLDAPALDSGRGVQVKRTLEILSGLFGGQQQNGKAALQKHLPSIVFVLTKASRVDAPLDTMKQWVISQAKNAGIALDEYKNQIVLYDPLCCDDSHKTRLKSLLAGAKPIESGQRFRTTLNAQDEKKLREIFEECALSIKECMNKADCDSATRDWKLLQALHVVDHAEIDKIVKNTRADIVAMARSWVAAVRQLHVDFSAKGRREVKRVLDLHKRNVPFVAQASQLNLADLMTEHMELCAEIKNIEAEHQVQENNAVKERISILRQALMAVLLKKADDDVGRKSMKSEFPELFGKSAEHAIKETQEGRDAMTFLIDTEKKAEGRRDYVFGDQHSLADLVKRHRDDIFRDFARIVEELRINCAARKCVELLLQHADSVVEANFSDLCAGERLRASDLAKLPIAAAGQAGFAEASVKELQEILAKVATLLAAGGCRLRATPKVEQEVNEMLSEIYDRARRQKEMWKERCHAFAKDIDKVLHAERLERDVQQLLEALNGLKAQGPEAEHMYKDKVDDLKTKVEKVQNEGDLITLVEARNFSEITKRYRMLKLLREKLADHLILDETPVRDFTVRHLDHLYKAAEEEVKSDPADPRYLECTSLRALTAIFPTLRTAFPEKIDECEANIKELADDKVYQTVERVKREVLDMGRELMTKDAQELVARMLVKGYSIATELHSLPAFQESIQKVLEQGLNDEGRYIIGMSLMSVEERDQVSAISARAIINSFPAFKNFNIKLFNEKASRVDFEQALKLLRCEPPCPSPSAEHDALQLTYKHYKDTYDAEVNEIVMSLKTYPVDLTKERIRKLSMQLYPHATTLSSCTQHFGELLGLVCAAWTYLSCREGGQYSGAEKKSVQQPHPTQILGIIRLLALDRSSLSNHLIQINTGEGKSIALGFTAVILAALGFSVDVVCYSRYLCERDRRAFQALFQLLDQEANISYNDFNTLSSKIMRNGVHLPEVRSAFYYFLEGDTLRSTKKRIRALDDDSNYDHGHEKCSKKGKNRAKDAGAAHRDNQDSDADSVEGAGECGTCLINLLLAQGNIQQCPEGHVQCADCFQQLGGDQAPCPVCTQKLGNIRNRYVENLRDAHQARLASKQDRKSAKEGDELDAADLSVDTYNGESARELGGDVVNVEKEQTRAIASPACGGGMAGQGGLQNARDEDEQTFNGASTPARAPSAHGHPQNQALCNGGDIESKQASKSVVQKISRPSVLLLDEVDIFFGEGFYGKPYRPCMTVHNEDASRLLHFIWDSRDVLPKSEASLQSLMARNEVAKLQTSLPNFSADILKRELTKMLDAAMRFPRNGKPKLRGGEQHYIVEDSVICYIDPVSGVPCPSISYGYVTVFTYLHCEEQGKLDSGRVMEHVKLQPICGTLSYSQIPTFYDYCLGMTGTLDCLTDEQDEVLNKYAFLQRTFLPSTFEKQALNALQEEQHKETLVVHGSYDEYFKMLLDDITRELIKGRAILLVFADMAKLERFSAAINLTSPNLPQYTDPLELSDRLSNDKRTSVVQQAIQRFRITLMTRSYGRGTDFVCHDKGLEKNGGVHVIVTFLPEDAAEHKQIMGRTCRQDNPGSGRMILFAEDLKYLDVSENKFAASGQNWDTFLRQHLDAFNASKYAAMQEGHEESMAKHQQTLSACEAVKRRDWTTASRLFFDASEELKVNAIVQTSGHHVIFVLDESGSMQGTPWQELVVAVRRFLQVRAEAGAQDLVSIVPFSDGARIACEMLPLADCREKLESLLSNNAWQGTRFSPALITAHAVIAKGLEHKECTPLLMFMSDGGAGDGADQMKILHENFHCKGLMVKTFGFGSGADSTKLKGLAELGGGEFAHAVDALELKQQFEQAAASLAHSF